MTFLLGDEGANLSVCRCGAKLPRGALAASNPQHCTSNREHALVLLESSTVPQDFLQFMDQVHNLCVEEAILS